MATFALSLHIQAHSAFHHPQRANDLYTMEDTPVRKYTRAVFADYKVGLFFVTCSTKEMRHYFGEIEEGTMRYSPLGAYLKACIEHTTEHFPDVEIEYFVVMPNHFHLLIRIHDTERAEAFNYGRLNAKARITVKEGHDPLWRCHFDNRLGNVVGSIKASVTRFARQNHYEFAWLPRYYDRIIRNSEEYWKVATYICDNVAKWGKKY